MRLFGIQVPAGLEAGVSACRDHFRLAIILSAVVNLLYLAPTIYMMQVYDRVVPTGGVTTLLWLTVVIAFALATLSVLDALRARVMLRASLRLDNALAATILDYMMAQPSSASARTSPLVAMREFDHLRAAIAGTPAIAMFDIVWTPIYVLVAFVVHPLIGALALFASIGMLGLAVANERANRESNAASLQAMASAYTAQERLAQRSELVRALGMRRAVIRRLADERQRALQLATQQQFDNGHYASIVKFVRLSLQSLALGLGAWLAIKHEISIGSIIAASVLISRALQPIELVVASWANIGQAQQAVEALGSLLSSHENAVASASQFSLPVPVGRVSVCGLSVESPMADSKALLADVSFDVEPGEFVGIIGPSGAGKTTLVRVLSGALAADQGTVRIDGSDMRDWDAEQLARHIGYLPQDAGLLPGSIADNIARFATARGEAPEAVSEKILVAARNAGIHDLIVALPGGYDRRIGWADEELSTGQRRRIALARALYDDPALLILDEPNAGLDAEGEAALARAVAGARARGATVLMVTHSAAILSGATRLLLLVNGRTSMFGEYQEVLAALQRTAAKSALSNAEVR